LLTSAKTSPPPGHYLADKPYFSILSLTFNDSQ
jgi:hypothetical protein